MPFTNPDATSWNPSQRQSRHHAGIWLICNARPIAQRMTSQPQMQEYYSNFLTYIGQLTKLTVEEGNVLQTVMVGLDPPPDARWLNAFGTFSIYLSSTPLDNYGILALLDYIEDTVSQLAWAATQPR